MHDAGGVRPRQPVGDLRANVRDDGSRLRLARRHEVVERRPIHPLHGDYAMGEDADAERAAAR
jgi:hypothetical protein